MLRILLSIWVVLGLGAVAAAQQAPQPKVKVNLLNVCAPSPQEQKEIASALARVPKEPLFSSDFEVDRGRSTLEPPPNFLQPDSSAHPSPNSPTAEWVRIRQEFAVQALFSAVQYSFSADPQNMVETLVFHVREPKDLMELSIEDSASAVTSPAGMMATDTPATHIKLERFGKSSVVLARCSASASGPAPDQSAYEPLFASASAVLADYRTLLHARHLVPEELERIRGVAEHKTSRASKLRRSSKPQK